MKIFPLEIRINICNQPVKRKGQISIVVEEGFFSPMPPHVLSDFVVSPARLWLKCNRLLRLGRPLGAVTLSRWEWWWNERWIWSARGGLKPNFYHYPDHGHHGRLPLSRKNTHGRAGNRTRNLIFSSRELWPPSREAGRQLNIQWMVGDYNLVKCWNIHYLFNITSVTHSYKCWVWRWSKMVIFQLMLWSSCLLGSCCHFSAFWILHVCILSE